MADGVSLASTLYVLQDIDLGTDQVAVTYQSFPYSHRMERLLVQMWAGNPLLRVQPRHGLLMQHTRGVSPGTGEFQGFRRLSDMNDTAQWLQAQPWWNGVLFGTGFSAMGILTYLAPLAGVTYRAQSVDIAAAAEYRMVYQDGAFHYHLVNEMLATVGQPRYNETYMAHEGPDAFWSATDLGRHYDLVEWPAVHIAGWFDVFQQDQLRVFDGYHHLAHPAVRDLQFLVIVPQGHCFSGWAVDWGQRKLDLLQGIATVIQDILFAAMQPTGTPKKAAVALRILRVVTAPIPRVFWFVMGPGLPGTKGNWITAANRLPTPEPTPLYLLPGGQLASSPASEQSQSSFVYDPRRPLRTWGGCILGNLPGEPPDAKVPCGPQDQMLVYGGRSDVLLFSSAPLQQEVAITGQVIATLLVSSNASDTDFVAKLVDVFSNGTRMLVADGVQRMRWRDPSKGPQPMLPGTVYEIQVDLWSTSYIFPAGHSIGLDISSSNFPRFDANPNTGEPLLRAFRHPRYAVAANSLHCGGPAGSRLTLPVVPLSALPPLPDPAVEALIADTRRALADLFPTAQ